MSRIVLRKSKLAKTLGILALSIPQELVRNSFIINSNTQTDLNYIYELDHLDALTRLHQTSLTFDHISALISFSQFWIEADNSQNAKRAAMMAKQTALALVKAESRNIFDNTFLTTSRRKRAMGTLTQENNSNDEVIDNNGDANNSSSKFTSPVFNMSEFVKNQDGSDCSSVLSTGMITAIEFESITDKGTFCIQTNNISAILTHCLSFLVLNHISSL